MYHSEILMIYTLIILTALLFKQTQKLSYST